MLFVRFASHLVLALVLLVVVAHLPGQPSRPEVVHTLKAHTDTVEAVAVSPDGRFIVTASFDKSVKLWDATTGKELRTYGGPQGHTGQVLCVAFSARGELIATGGADNKVLVWDVPAAAPSKMLPISGAGTAVAVANDGKTAAAAGVDGIVKVFPLGEEKGSFELRGHTGPVLDVGHVATGNIWVTAGADRTLRFWNGADGKQIAAYHTGTPGITGLGVRSDGKGAFTVSADGVLRFWQAPPQQSREFAVLKEGVTAFFASADGNTLLYASADKVVTLASVNNNQMAGTFTGAKAVVECVALSPDANTVVAGGSDGALLVWDRQRKLNVEVAAHAGGVTAVAFHPSLPTLHTAGADGIVKGWSVPFDTKKSDDKEKKEVKPTKFEFRAHMGKINGLVVHAGTGHLITAGGDKFIRVWDPSRLEKPVREIGPLATAPTTLLLSRDNLTLAAGVGKEVLLWTFADGKEVGKFPQPADVLSLSFSADTSRLLIGRSDNLAELIEIATGNVVQGFAHAGAVRGVLVHPSVGIITASADKTIVVSPISCLRVIPLGNGKPVGVVVSPGGERVVTVGPGKEVVSWSTGTGGKERTFELQADATAAAISKDVQRVAVGAADGTIKVFTTADAKLVGSIAAGAPVQALAFEPKNAILAALLKNKDNTVAAWNVAFQPGQPTPPEFGRQLQTFSLPVSVAGLAFNADGQFFTAGADKQVRRFRIASDNPVRIFPHPNLVNAVAFDDTGDRLATGGQDGVLRLFDVPKGAQLKQVNAHVVTMPQQAQHPIYAVLWSHDYNQLFTSSYDKSIKLWDVASGNLVREFKAAADPVPEKKDDKSPPPKKDTDLVGHRDQVFSIALSKDGKFLASVSSDKSIKLWDVSTGKVVRDFPNPDLRPVFPDEPAPSHPSEIRAVRFSPDGSKLITAGLAPQGRAYLAVWNVADGKRIFGAERDHGPVHALALYPDGTRIVLGCAGVPRRGWAPAVYVLKTPGS